MIVIPEEYSSQVGNEEDESSNSGIGDEDEVNNYTEVVISDNGDNGGNGDNGEGMQMEINHEDVDGERDQTQVRRRGRRQEQEDEIISRSVEQQPNSSQRTLRSGTQVNYRYLNDPYSRESRATLARNVGSGMDEDRELAQLYITAEDIDDELKPEIIPARDLLLCLENLYLRKYVHG